MPTRSADAYSRGRDVLERKRETMDGRQLPGRRGDGIVVPALLAALMGGVGVLAVTLVGVRGFTDVLSTSSATGSAVAPPSRVAGGGATATGTPGTDPVPGPVPTVEARTAPPPIQVTP